MGFLDKYAFPNQAIYNAKSQGGSKCTGTTIVELNQKKISNWSRNDALRNYNESEMDSEFLPFINRINALQDVITCQCCIGHMTSPDYWGYLSLYVTPAMAMKLAQRLDPKEWLLSERSQIWTTELKPVQNEQGDIMLVFAWKAEYWPLPAIQITDTLEEIQACIV